MLAFPKRQPSFALLGIILIGIFLSTAPKQCDGVRAQGRAGYKDGMEYGVLGDGGGNPYANEAPHEEVEQMQMKQKIKKKPAKVNMEKTANMPPPPPPPKPKEVVKEKGLKQAPPVKNPPPKPIRKSPPPAQSRGCYECYSRDATCDKPNKMTDTNSCGLQQQTTTNSNKNHVASCITFRAINKGPSDDNLREPELLYKHRLQGRTCNIFRDQVSNVVLRNVTDCAEDYLSVKLEEGKCVKATSKLEFFDVFQVCAGLHEKGASNQMKDPTPYTEEQLRKALYWGENGQFQYVILEICVCKGDFCNKHRTDDLDDAVIAENWSHGHRVSAGATIKSFGTLTIAITAIIAVSLNHLNQS